MNKGQIIAEIQRLNTSAQEVFLSQFQDRELALYLESLQADRAKGSHTVSFPDQDEQPARLAS
ncbi:MAG: hypothetical protein ABSH20_11145 [Tepidisphaeraceae bacterium]